MTDTGPKRMDLREDFQPEAVRESVIENDPRDRLATEDHKSLSSCPRQLDVVRVGQEQGEDLTDGRLVVH